MHALTTGINTQQSSHIAEVYNENKLHLNNPKPNKTKKLKILIIINWHITK